jgi:hypothetical protein
VLHAMADHSDHDGRNIYVGTAKLAWKTGYSERHVLRIVARLLERGVVALDYPDKRPGKLNPFHIEWMACVWKAPLEPKKMGRPARVLGKVHDNMSPTFQEVPDKMSPTLEKVHDISGESIGHPDGKYMTQEPKVHDSATREPGTEPFNRLKNHINQPAHARDTSQSFFSGVFRNGHTPPPGSAAPPPQPKFQARLSPCKYPGCDGETNALYCHQHGTLQSYYRELRPEFADGGGGGQDQDQGQESAR